MLLAVTERALGLPLDRDVFVATVGGAKLTDPATDLAVCIAVASARLDVAMPADVAVIGEVALSGDIRPVGQLPQRVAEAARLGYRRILVPPSSGARLKRVPAGSAVVELEHLSRALERLHEFVAAPRAR
jgi:DNA repair protein RadA/Sms